MVLGRVQVMWETLSRFVVAEQQDGRSGVEDGVDPATKGQAVGGNQY